MCQTSWSNNKQCCHDCAIKCTLAFDVGGVITQHEIVLINSGGAACSDELAEAKHHELNQAQKGYK